MKNTFKLLCRNVTGHQIVMVSVMPRKLIQDAYSNNPINTFEITAIMNGTWEKDQDSTIILPDNGLKDLGDAYSGMTIHDVLNKHDWEIQ